MSTRMLSEEQLEQLRSFPDVGKDELIRFFTLTPADVAFVDPGRGRGPGDRLGAVVHPGAGVSDLGQDDPAGRDDPGEDGRYGKDRGRGR